MEKSTIRLLNKLFNVCGLPEDPPEPIGASFFPIGLSDIPLVQRAKMEKEAGWHIQQIVGKGEKTTVDTDISDTLLKTETYTCSSCGQSGLSRDEMSKDATVISGIKKVCKKCTSLREAELEKIRKSTRIVLDFRKIPNGQKLLEKIKKNAEDNWRTPDAEVLFMLKSAGFLCLEE